MIDSELVGPITQELKRLARHGGNPRVAANLYTIIELAGIDDGYWEERGLNVREFILECIEKFEDKVWCYVRWLEPKEYQAAMVISLGLYAYTIEPSSEDRCRLTVRHLKLPYEYETWRKYRIALFERLARHILEYTA